MFQVLKEKTMKKLLKLFCVSLAFALFVLFSACFISCKDEPGDDVLFYTVYNSDGTIGEEGLTTSEWKKILESLSDGSKIVLASDITADDLEKFAAALKTSELSDICVDISLTTITEISKNTFCNCTNIISVIFPDSLVSIGSYAFYGCNALESVTINKKLESIESYAFYGCEKISSVTYNGTTTQWNEIEISDDGNTNLTSATVVCSDGTVTNGQVSLTSSLDSVTISAEETIAANGISVLTAQVSFSNISDTSAINYSWEIIEGADYVVISSSNGNIVTISGINTDSSSHIIKIGVTVSYNGLNSIEASVEITISAVVATEENDTDDDDDSEISNKWTTFLSVLSDGCTINLTSSLISSTSDLELFVSALKASTLSDVNLNLSALTITEIAEETFSNCTNIVSVILSDNMTTIGSESFSGCTNLASVTISDGVTTIGNDSFYQCASLTSIIIPDSVISLGSSAFRSCTNLQTASIGNGMESIPAYAFYSCSKLESITIGTGITSVGDYAFGTCSSLVSVTYSGTTTQWGGINISSTGNSFLTSVTIVCSDGSYSE